MVASRVAQDDEKYYLPLYALFRESKNIYLYALDKLLITYICCLSRLITILNEKIFSSHFYCSLFMAHVLPDKQSN
jgi:hypothetical protein